VRLHTGAAATRSAHELEARAYTAGRHIVFGGGEYAPDSAAGQRLLAHELVHVVQQGAAAPLDIAPAAFSMRLIDEAGSEKFLRPATPEVTPMPIVDEDNLPVQRTPARGADLFVQRKATFTQPTPKPDNPLVRMLKGDTPGLTSPIINGTKTPTAAQLQAAFTPSQVKQTANVGGVVTCQVDNFDLDVGAEQIVADAAPKGGWTATVKPAAGISSAPKCAKVPSITVTMNAKPTNADFVKLVQQSEDEHVTDLRALFNRYLVPYEAFVSSLRGVGADLNACGQNIVQQLGFRFMEAAFEFTHGWATSVEKFDGALGTHTGAGKLTTNAACSAASLDVDAPAPMAKGAAPGNVAPVNPTVITFNPTTLKASGKELKDGKTLVKKFSSAANAAAALAVIQHYGMTSRNEIGPFEYWLVGKAAPSGALKGANEVAINAADHQVTYDFPNAGEWAITQIESIAKGLNVNLIASFGKNRDQAYAAWQVLSAFGFTQKVWLGGTRATPEMTYYRT
jgi:hypothetical protein